MALAEFIYFCDSFTKFGAHLVVLCVYSNNITVLKLEGFGLNNLEHVDFQ